MKGPRNCGRPGYTRETGLHKCFPRTSFDSWIYSVDAVAVGFCILHHTQFMMRPNFFNFLVCALKGLPSDQQALTCCPRSSVAFQGAKSSHPQLPLKSSHPQQPLWRQPLRSSHPQQPLRSHLQQPLKSSHPQQLLKVKEQPSSAAILLRSSHPQQISSIVDTPK